MSQKYEVYNQFLDKFVEEILLILKTNQLQKNQESSEQERLIKSIEVEKLKQKFSNYLSQKPLAAQPKPIVIKQLIPPQPPSEQIQKPKIERQIQKIKVEIPKILDQTLEGVYFGNIVSLVKDSLVTHIDCPGPNKGIAIRKSGRVLKTQLTIDKDEISKIISSFSERAKIPLIEGMLKARIHNLEMSAVVSPAGSSFIIMKMGQENQQPQVFQRVPAPMFQRPQSPIKAQRGDITVLTQEID